MVHIYNVQSSQHVIYIVTCMVVHVTNKMGSSSDDWIYGHFRLQPLLITFKYKQRRAIAESHTFKFTVAHAL
jgi:hypothetical protein